MLGPKRATRLSARVRPVERTCEHHHIDPFADLQGLLRRLGPRRTRSGQTRSGAAPLLPQKTPDRSDGGAGSADDRSGRDGGGYGRGRRPWLMRSELQDQDRGKRSDPLDGSRTPARRRAGQDPSYPAPPRRGSLHSWPVLAHGIDVDGPEERSLTLLTGTFDAPLGPPPGSHSEATALCLGRPAPVYLLPGALGFASSSSASRRKP